MSLRRLRAEWHASGARRWAAVLACLLVGHPLLHEAGHAAEPVLDCHRVNTHLDAGHRPHADDCTLCRQLGADRQSGPSVALASPRQALPGLAAVPDAPQPPRPRAHAPRGPPSA